jgi:hypothetical protein
MGLGRVSRRIRGQSRWIGLTLMNGRQLAWDWERLLESKYLYSVCMYQHLGLVLGNDTSRRWWGIQIYGQQNMCILHTRYMDDLVGTRIMLRIMMQTELCSVFPFVRQYRQCR